MLASTASASSCLEATQLCQTDAAAPSSKLHSSLREFQWQLELKQKLHHVFSSIQRHFYLQNLCCVQVWLSATGCQHEQNLGQMQMYADPNLALLGDAGFSEFRTNSCHNILPGRYGMPGRVWIGGCVQVVQNISIIPNCLHPRSKLLDELVEHVGEVVYITVYDPSRPHVGPVAVLEALFACKSTDSMMVANFISFVGSALLQMKLTLSDPAPKPFKCSKLAGRKPVMTSEPDVATEQQQQQQQQAVTAAAKPPPAAAAVVRTAGAVRAAGDDEDEGCGDTHASDDEADGVGLTAAAVETVLEPGQRAGNRPVKQVLGKRKADRNAAVGTDGRPTSATDGSKKQQQQQDQLVGEAVPAVSRAGGAGASAAASAPPAGAISGRSSPAPIALPAASHDSTHGPAAAGGMHGSQDSLQAIVGAVAAVAPISARSDATAAAALVAAGGAVGITLSAVSQQEGPTPEATGAGGAAVTSSAASQEGAGAVGAMHAPRPRKMLRGLSMTRTKSVPMDLCVMEVASTASSKPKGVTV